MHLGVDRSDYIQLLRTRDGELFKAGDTFRVQVYSSRPLSSLNYVISNGQEILASEKLAYKASKTEMTLELTCPSNAAPESSLLVYTSVSNGDITADGLVLKVASNLDGNFLNISSSATTALGSLVTTLRSL